MLIIYTEVLPDIIIKWW